MEETVLYRKIKDRNERYSAELETYFRSKIIGEYEDRAKKKWNRAYNSLDIYNKSIESNRKRWESIISPPDLGICGEVEYQDYELLGDKEDINVKWIKVPLDGGLFAEGILAFPSNKEISALVIAQHGISSSPESTFGLLDRSGAYHSYAKKLLDEGFSVLAPFNLATSKHRSRIHRMAVLMGTTLCGLEFTRLKHLIDVVISNKKINSEKIAMWGISLGGFATQMWMPLEQRIKVGISCAFFNKRLEKMIIPDPRYTCFLSTNEEHIFIPNWMTEFTDSDLISMICPRPFLIQIGKADRILGWWPMILKEYQELSEHYKKLNISERISMDLHDEGHEIRLVSGIEWLKKWL